MATRHRHWGQLEVEEIIMVAGRVAVVRVGGGVRVLDTDGGRSNEERSKNNNHKMLRVYNRRCSCKIVRVVEVGVH